MTRCLRLGAMLLMVVLGSLIAFYPFYRLMCLPMPINKASDLVIKLEKATSASTLADLLQSRHLIQSSRVLITAIRISRLSHRLQAGIYVIHPGETAWAFVHRVVLGDVLRQAFRIIAGTTYQHVLTDLKHTAYLSSTHIAERAIFGPYPPEGLLLADTYFFNAGSDATALLMRAHAHLDAEIAAVWQSRDKMLPYRSSYDLLIAASIIEKESALPDERRLISGVIVNRLNKKMPLQMDPTVIYGLGSAYHGQLTHAALHQASPYNSYKNRGLPPTPIAMVGHEALYAAAHPQKTAYLYFVAKGDRSHQFSETYEAQRQAIEEYIKKDHA